MTVTTPIINVADIKDSATGKTYRQLNSEKTHKYPLNSIVKCLRYDYENPNADENGFVDDPHGLVQRVVLHSRDCDQTPLYGLSHMTAEEYQENRNLMKRAVVWVDGMRLKGELFATKIDSGHSEESLKLIALPEQLNLEA